MPPAEQRPLVDELRDALVCLLAVVDLADSTQGASDDLHQAVKEKARAVLRRVHSERPIGGPRAAT
jgi:hypothetical protein